MICVFLARAIYNTSLIVCALKLEELSSDPDTTGSGSGVLSKPRLTVFGVCIHMKHISVFLSGGILDILCIRMSAPFAPIHTMIVSYKIFAGRTFVGTFVALCTDIFKELAIWLSFLNKLVLAVQFNIRGDSFFNFFHFFGVLRSWQYPGCLNVLQMLMRRECFVLMTMMTIYNLQTTICGAVCWWTIKNEDPASYPARCFSLVV